MKRKQLIRDILKYIILILILIFLLFPVIWVLINSFKTNMEAYKYPPTLIPELPTAQSYIQLFSSNNEFFVYYKNNFVVSFAVAILVTAMAILAGYSLSRFNFKWNFLFIALFTSAQMLPVVSRLISLYKLLADFNLINTLTGLILALTATQLPFSALLMSSFFDSVPKEIEEAALVDGAGRIRNLISIVVPLVKSGIVTVAIYAFLLTWDDYLHASTLVQTDSLRTLSVGISLRYLGELSYDWSLINTISIISTLPLIVVFFIFQKHIVKGLTAGAVKG